MEVEEASELLSHMHSKEERVAAVYSEAIALKIREGAPLASYSIDRKCLRKGAEATSGDNIQALICFFFVLAFIPIANEKKPKKSIGTRYVIFFDITHQKELKRISVSILTCTNMAPIP